VHIALVIKKRLEELGLEQRDLARAVQVTESYISQLLTQKKLPPDSNRTDIYDKMGKLLKLPGAELAKLADLQRREQMMRKMGDPPGPLLKDVRDLILTKCHPARQTHVRTVFEKQPFGELERFITQRLLDIVKGVARQELDNERWIRRVARLSRRSYEQMRVSILEFLDANIFNLSMQNCVSFLGPLIKSWDIDLATFSMEVVLNRAAVSRHLKKFEFVERELESSVAIEPGLTEFLADRSLSGGTTEEEVEFLKKLRFKTRRPTPLYYYRERQNLRDPLHFRSSLSR
jgi:transcriptional regulator with XRE-family HTH domain